MALQEVFWSRLAESADVLHSAAVAVWHLQRVLAKKRDPLSHELFLDIVLEAFSGSQGPAEEGAANDGTAALPCNRFW